MSGVRLAIARFKAEKIENPLSVVNPPLIARFADR